MQRKIQFFVVGLLAMMLALLAAGVMAQDATEEAAEGAEQSCTPEQWAEFLPGLTETVNQVEGSEDILSTLLLLDAYIGSMRSACTGGIWTSEEHGAAGAVIGPIVFDGTLYKATLSTENNASVQVTAIEGNCGYAAVGAVSSDEETESEALWKFEGCVAFLEVQGFGNPWTLTISKLK